MLFHIEQNIDYETIIKSNQEGYESFVDPKDGIVEEWKIKKTNSGYSKKLAITTKTFKF